MRKPNLSQLILYAAAIGYFLLLCYLYYAVFIFEFTLSFPQCLKEGYYLASFFR